MEKKIKVEYSVEEAAVKTINTIVTSTGVLLALGLAIGSRLALVRLRTSYENWEKSWEKMHALLVKRTFSASSTSGFHSRLIS